MESRELNQSLPSPAPSIGIPILFVHGLCGHASEGDALLGQLKTTLNGLYPTLFPNVPIYVAFYDGSVVKFQKQTERTFSQLDPNARVFEVALFDPTGPTFYQDFNPLQVAEIPIFQKGNELAQIIWTVKAVTGAPRVMIVGHSMGGLDARAYIEQLAGADAHHSTTFENDLATLVTLDTPHGGASVVENTLLLPRPVRNLSDQFLSCLSFTTTNKQELIPTSITLKKLNYALAGAIPLPFGLTIYSIKSYYTEPCCHFFTSFGLYGEESDNVLLNTEQDLAATLPTGTSLSQVNTVENNNFSPGKFSCGEFVPLHTMQCVGTSSTLNTIQSELLPLIGMTKNITVTPATVQLSPGTSQQFQASSSVTWSIREGQPCGNITTTGTYTAPPKQGVCHVVGVLENANAYGEATVTVQ